MSRTCDCPQQSHFMQRIFIKFFLIQTIYHWWCATSDARDAKRGWITSSVEVGGFHRDMDPESHIAGISTAKQLKEHRHKNNWMQAHCCGNPLFFFLTSFWKEDFMVSSVFHCMFSKHPAQWGSGPCWGGTRKNYIYKICVFSCL